jgi:redox-sensitive bicupin YhaK (pirin superfamily)
MLTQTEARIYLAANRGCTQSDGVRSFHTFDCGEYRGVDRAGFGSLTAFNEDTLLPGKRLTISAKNTVEIILIPIVGGLELVDSQGESVFVSVGETFRFLAFPESDFAVVNPYDDETISYVQIILQPDLSGQVVDNDMDNEPFTTISFEKENTLVPAFHTSGNKVCGFLGQYGGRQEHNYQLRSNENGVFVFIIHGAFEVQNRLLEKGDGLSLQNIETLEFEALSNKAIILVVEMGE